MHVQSKLQSSAEAESRIQSHVAEEEASQRGTARYAHLFSGRRARKSVPTPRRAVVNRQMRQDGGYIM